MSSPHGSDYEDDAAIEEAVAKDAFGLSSFTGATTSKGKATKDSKASAKSRAAAEVTPSSRKGLVTNPDVLTEVWLCYQLLPGWNAFGLLLTPCQSEIL